ncbi:MAG: type IV toxin-antitoxin system AbiEi family antitoxin domain-containing protein [Terriglobales bacterium]
MTRKRRNPPDHRALYNIAEQQAGYFTTQQAAGASFSRERLVEHARTGRFKRLGRGIYRLSQFPSSPVEDLFVAWLRCGPKAVISHDSALALHNLSDVVPGEIHITVARSSSRRRKGLRQHTSRLLPSDIKRREGLPVTSVPRTLGDAAKTGLAEEFVGEAILQALKRGLTDRKALQREARRRGGRAARLMRKYLDKGGARS